MKMTTTEKQRERETKVKVNEGFEYSDEWLKDYFVFNNRNTIKLDEITENGVWFNYHKQYLFVSSTALGILNKACEYKFNHRVED